MKKVIKSQTYLQLIDNAKKTYPADVIKFGDIKINRWERNEHLCKRSTEESEYQMEKIDCGYAAKVLESISGKMTAPDFNLVKKRGVNFEDLSMLSIKDGEDVKDKTYTTYQLIKQLMEETGFTGVFSELNESVVMQGNAFCDIGFNDEGMPSIQCVSDLDNFAWDVNFYRLKSPDNNRKSMWACHLTEMSKPEFDEYMETLQGATFTNEDGKDEKLWDVSEAKKAFGRVNTSFVNETLEERRRIESETEIAERDDKDFVQFYDFRILRDAEDKEPRRFLICGSGGYIAEYKGAYPFTDLEGNPTLGYGELEAPGRSRSRYAGGAIDRIADVHYALNTSLNIIMTRAYSETYLVFMCRNKEVENSLIKAFQNARAGMARTLSADFDDSKPEFRDKPISFFFEPIKYPPLSVDIKELTGMIKELSNTKSGIYLNVLSDNLDFATQGALKAESTNDALQVYALVNQKNLNYKRIVEEFVARCKFYFQQILINSEGEDVTYELNDFKKTVSKETDEKGRPQYNDYLESAQGESVDLSISDIIQCLDNVNIEIKPGSAMENNKAIEFNRLINIYTAQLQIAPELANSQEWKKLVMRDLSRNSQTAISEEDIERIYNEMIEKAKAEQEQLNKANENNQKSISAPTQGANTQGQERAVQQSGRPNIQ